MRVDVAAAVAFHYPVLYSGKSIEKDWHFSMKHSHLLFALLDGINGCITKEAALVAALRDYEKLFQKE